MDCPPSTVSKSRTEVCSDSSSGRPVLTVADSLDLVATLREASIELPHYTHQQQELSIAPDANITGNVPDGLDLYKVIFGLDTDSDSDHKKKSNIRQVSDTDSDSDSDNDYRKPARRVLTQEERDQDPIYRFFQESGALCKEDPPKRLPRRLQRKLLSESESEACPSVASSEESESEQSGSDECSESDHHSELEESEIDAVASEAELDEEPDFESESELEVESGEKVGVEVATQTSINVEEESASVPELEERAESQADSDMDYVDAVAAVAPDEIKVDSCKLVGGSKFYESMESASALDVHTTPSPTEKHDNMKPESDEDVSDVDQDCTLFDGVSYLGAQNISDPKCETDIQRIMKELCFVHESHDGIAVSISVPTCSQGLVVLYVSGSSAVMARYNVNRISFYARGAAGTPVAACFAFTWSHGETKESAVYRCHVFRCKIAEAVLQVSNCFAKAFERIPRSMASSIVGELSGAPSMTSSIVEPPPVSGMQLMHVLECTLSVKECDAKGVFNLVPRDRFYRLRGGIDKQVTINVHQVNNNVEAGTDDSQASNRGLFIERCFGILLAPGRSVKQSDMRLLEMVSGSSGGANSSVCALWNAGESSLSAFNVTSEGAPTYMSLAVDLVIRGIADPLRLVIETPVKICPPTERFWYATKRSLVQQFMINLKESTDSAGQLIYEVASVETSGELDRSRINLQLTLSSLLPSPAAAAPAPALEPDSDGDEPLLSGTGEVSKDCGEDVLENWAQVLRSWTGPRPRALAGLVRAGVPEALRGEVWLRLAGVDQNHKLMDMYRTLISKECVFESVIQRDIARTFPAHDFFREAGGLGQDSLLRIARAYSVYDQEVGYCQGLSFLAATLLLHMPEEQAFCLLVRLMYGYGLREMYKDGFEALYMRLHQLDRIIEEQLSDIRTHFTRLGVESHMFASQWFLTLFTARFPLPLVYHIIDVFLLQGMDTLFQVAVAMLTRSRKELLNADFEGVLKHFRVALPKKCRAEEAAKQIMKSACSVKVKRLPKYQQEYEKFMKEAAEKEKTNLELDKLKSINTQLQQEKDAAEAELAKAQEATKEALKEADHHAAVARDYREICARVDKQLHQIQDIVKGCTACSAKLSQKNNKNDSPAEGVCGGGAGGGSGGGAGGGGGSSDREAALRQRVRELELELAQVKLEHVEAQCSNQELSHQLSTALNEASNNQPRAQSAWLTRTLGSIMEAAQNRPTFQTYLQNVTQEPTTPLRRQNSHGSQGHLDRRVSEPYSPVVRRRDPTKRHSMVESNKAKENEINRRSQELTPANMVKNLSMG